MNLPNVLTILRFFMVPIFVWLFFFEGEYGILAAGGVFVLAGLTDILDGYLARKMNLITDFGKLADPAADKLMQITAFVCLFLKKMVPLWMLIVILLKELSMILVGGLLYRKGTVVSSKGYGKIASTVFYGALALSLLFRKLPHAVALIAFGVAIFLSLAAAVRYVLDYKESIKNIKKSNYRES